MNSMERLVDRLGRSAAPRTRASIRFQIAFARWAASSEPSSSHCSKLLLSAISRAVERGLEVGERVRRCRGSAGPGRSSRIASSAWPFSDRSTPFTKTAGHPALVGVEDELLVADREAALEPARGVEDEVRRRRGSSAGTSRPTRRPPGRRRSSRRTGCRRSGTARRAGARARP